MAEPVAGTLRRAANLEELSRAAAGMVGEIVSRALVERDRCTVALAGGRTPHRLYELLAGPCADAAPWGQVDWFFGDERCVGVRDPESNFRLARESLFEPLAIESRRVHRMAGEQPPAVAAAAYEASLRATLADGRFDLVLLGLGADGHTASLFPGSPALDEKVRWVISTEAPPDAAVRNRLTLTLPALNAARAVIVLAAGADKRGATGRVMAGDRTAPAARVRPAGSLAWLFDDAALGS